MNMLLYMPLVLSYGTWSAIFGFSRDTGAYQSSQSAYTDQDRFWDKIHVSMLVFAISFGLFALMVSLLTLSGIEISLLSLILLQFELAYFPIFCSFLLVSYLLCGIDGVDAVFGGSIKGFISGIKQIVASFLSASFIALLSLFSILEISFSLGFLITLTSLALFVSPAVFFVMPTLLALTELPLILVLRTFISVFIQSFIEEKIYREGLHRLLQWSLASFSWSDQFKTRLIIFSSSLYFAMEHVAIAFLFAQPIGYLTALAPYFCMGALFGAIYEDTLQQDKEDRAYVSSQALGAASTVHACNNLAITFYQLFLTNHYATYIQIGKPVYMIATWGKCFYSYAFYSIRSLFVFGCYKYSFNLPFFRHSSSQNSSRQTSWFQEDNKASRSTYMPIEESFDAHATPYRI